MSLPEEFPVVFQPGDKRIFVLSGTRLQEAATAADLVLDAPCGGEGVCGKCRVVVSDGAKPPTPEEQRLLSAEELHAGCRLACQASVEGPMNVLVPITSLVNRPHQILTESAATLPAEGPPVISKRYLELSAPDRGDDMPDLQRLETAVGPLEVELGMLAELPRQLRASGFRGTAVLDQRRLIDFEPENTEWESYGVAIDLGTTTLVAALLDLATGREVRIASRLNPQTRFGDDVLSRILLARTRPEGLQQLRCAIVEAIDAMIGELCDASGLLRRQVYTVTVAGNTTMQQLFCGIDPSPLGETPFVPAIRRGHSLAAAEGRLGIHPRGRIYILPIVGAFVGGDIVGGIVATGLADCRGPALLIDIGTNGEIALAVDGRIAAASTAAGPAFEGARIAHGMRACHGAIEKVVIDDVLQINVIGHVAPIGLCGSALIDATAELLRHGILSPQGRLAAPGEVPAGVSPDLAARIDSRDGQPIFVLSDCLSPGGRKIAITQRDIREIQLASGAIRTGIELLLRQRGLRPADVDRVFLAGGFGNYIRRSNAQRMGLLPREIPHQRIRYRGNASLAGARLAALSLPCREKCDALAAQIDHVDLSLDPDFAATFANAMIFPEADS